MALDGMHVDLTVVLGRARLPLHQLLRMRRGALLALDAGENDDVEVLANGHPIARGQVAVRGDAISVAITGLIRAPERRRERGDTVGASHAPSQLTSPAEAA